jgi:hypothetical protein
MIYKAVEVIWIFSAGGRTDGRADGRAEIEGSIRGPRGPKNNKLAKLGDVIAISESETITHSLTH